MTGQGAAAIIRLQTARDISAVMGGLDPPIHAITGDA